MEYQLNLIKVFDSVLKRAWIIISVGVITLALGFLLVDGSGSNMYAASSSIYSASYASYQESVMGMNIMRDYVDIINSRKVAERASAYLSQEVSADEIRGMVSANFASDSKIITITATTDNPGVAIIVANAVADAFIQEVVSITADESVKVLDSAYVSKMVMNAQYEAMKARILIAIIAVIIVVGAIAAFAVFDSRVTLPQDVTLGGKIELLGVIPNRKI